MSPSLRVRAINRHGRPPFVVAGPGALKLPQIMGYAVCLVFNAALVTPGTVPRNDFTRALLKRDDQADSGGRSLVLPDYHVESGSRVIFTEHPRCPKELIDCPRIPSGTFP